DTATTRRVVARFVVEPDCASDPLQGVVEMAGEMRDRRVLLQHRGLFARIETVDEAESPTVVRIGLTVRFERGGAARGEQHVGGDGLLVTGRLGVVDDVCGIPS